MRIEIRAAAALSCFGEGPEAHRLALRTGRCGLLQRPGHSGGPALPCARIGDQSSAELRPLELAEHTLQSVLEQAGLGPAERRSCALFLGTTTGLSATEELLWLEQHRLGKPWHANMRSGGLGRLAAVLASRLGSRAPLFTYTTACTSTAVALVMAARLVRAGQVERALVLGLDVLMGIAADGFRYLQLYSETGCRPFDRDRDGLQLGEGCAALLLEKGGSGRFEMLDGAIAHDSSHIASGSSDGRTAAGVMAEAMRRSRVERGSITAIKAHGTGTPANDLSELNALTKIFGERPPPFSSLKGALGHTLGASSALETAAWLWCLEEGFLPPTVGFANAAQPGLEPLRQPLPLDGRPGVHLFNAFGFGGTSVSYLIRDRGTR